MKPSLENVNIIKELIGKGSSALVYKMVDLINNKIIAVKESLSKDAEFLFKNEINIFNKFQNNNPYIVHFYNYKILSNKIILELEYCQYGSLRDLLRKAKKKRIKITENEISSIIYMVLNGLNFIHQNNIINKDVKSKNILINKEGIAKLCDFGISQPYKNDLYPKNKEGSPYWMAPELINMQKYNKSIDIWSLGITCIELAEYEPPYINFDKNEALNRIKRNPPKGLSYPNKWSNEFNDFVKICLNVNKYQRPTCKELLEHDFIKNIEIKNLNRKLIILKMLSKIGYKVIYSRKNAIVKSSINNDNDNNNNLLFSKTFYNTKNNFFKTKKNFLIRNETYNEEDKPDYNNYSIQSNLKKFNLQSKILQKRIINLKYENFQDLNNSDNIQIHQKYPSIYSYMNNKNNNTTKFSNHTINMSLLNESINNYIQNQENNRDRIKNVFIEKIKHNKGKRNNSRFNKGFNISDYNYNNSYNNLYIPRYSVNEAEIRENNSIKGLKNFCYNPKIIQIQKMKKINQTLNNQNYTNNRIISINNDSKNISNNRKNRINSNNLQSNNPYIKTRGDLTISTTLSK